MTEIIPTNNASFKYGIGLVETMRCNPLIIFLGKYHYQRLVNSFHLLNMKNPFESYEHFEQIILEQVDFNIRELYRVRMQIYPKEIHYFSTELIECGIHLECEQYFHKEHNYTIGILQNVTKPYQSLSSLKTNNMATYYLGSVEAKQNNWHDGILLNSEGNIVESTIANIFAIKHNIIYTPTLNDGATAGVFRQYLIDNLSIVEKSISVEELTNMDAIFLTNSLRGIMPINKFLDKEYSLEPINKIKNKLQS